MVEYRDDGYYLITYAITGDGTDFRVPKGSVHSSRGTTLKEKMQYTLYLLEISNHDDLSPEDVVITRYKDLPEDEYLDHDHIAWESL